MRHMVVQLFGIGDRKALVAGSAYQRNTVPTANGFDGWLHGLWVSYWLMGDQRAVASRVSKQVRRASRVRIKITRMCPACRPV